MSVTDHVGRRFRGSSHRVHRCFSSKSPAWYPEPPDDAKTTEIVIPSRRWRHVRMGIEDYILLRMAQERIDSLGDDGTAYRHQLDELLRVVLTNRASDRGLFRSKRRELVELLDRKGKERK